jgi:hypothetical protein
VKYLTWTEDNLLRPVMHEGLRDDKPAAEFRRPMPYPKPDSDPQGVFHAAKPIVAFISWSRC